MKTSLIQRSLQATGAAPASRVLQVVFCGLVAVFAALTYLLAGTDFPTSIVAGITEVSVIAGAILRYARYKRERVAANAATSMLATIARGAK